MTFNVSQVFVEAKTLKDTAKSNQGPTKEHLLGKYCYGLNCVSSKFLCWTPNPKYLRMLTMFGDRAFKEVMKVKWGHMNGLQSDMIGVPKRREIRTDTHTHTHTENQVKAGRRWPSISQGERPKKNPTFPTSWCCTCSLQSCEKISICGLSHPVCCTLSWQPEQTHTDSHAHSFCYLDPSLPSYPYSCHHSRWLQSPHIWLIQHLGLLVPSNNLPQIWPQSSNFRDTFLN